MILIITALLSQKYNMYHIEKYNDRKNITLSLFLLDINKYIFLGYLF